MTDKEYKTRQIRVDDEIWAAFEKLKKSTGKTWNLFIKDINSCEYEDIDGYRYYLKDFKVSPYGPFNHHP